MLESQKIIVEWKKAIVSPLQWMLRIASPTPESSCSCCVLSSLLTASGGHSPPSSTPWSATTIGRLGIATYSGSLRVMDTNFSAAQNRSQIKMKFNIGHYWLKFFSTMYCGESGGNLTLAVFVPGPWPAAMLLALFIYPETFLFSAPFAPFQSLLPVFPYLIT